MKTLADQLSNPAPTNSLIDTKITNVRQPQPESNLNFPRPIEAVPVPASQISRVGSL